MTGINPELLKLARAAAVVGWAPPAEKAAADPAAGGAPPMDPSMGGGAPGGAGGGAPGPVADPAMQQQIMTMVQQAMAAGGGAGGKGAKSPKDQIQASQTKIIIHLLAQLCQHAGIKVDPTILVPPSDPAGEQMAMQEMQNSSMVPGSSDQGGGAPPGGDPNAAAGGAGPAMPSPVQPMDAGTGPIGKSAAYGGRIGRAVAEAEAVAAIGSEYGGNRIREAREKSAAQIALIRALGRDR